MIYSPTQWRRGEMFLFADHRLAYPITSVWSPAMERLFWLARTRPGERDERAERMRGASRYRQRTQLGSVGFRIDDHGRLIARWPYAEEDRSAMLDASGTPAVAFYPLENGLDFFLEYEFGLRPAAEFSEAIRLVVGRIVSLAELKPSNVDLNLLDAIDLRLDSAAKTFRTTPVGFSGFILTFDPQRGYDSEAKAFGASIAEHAMLGSRNILEYGFTGRQLNIAYCLAKRDLERWRERASAVIDSFVSRMATPSGVGVHAVRHEHRRAALRLRGPARSGDALPRRQPGERNLHADDGRGGLRSPAQRQTSRTRWRPRRCLAGCLSAARWFFRARPEF